MAQGIGNFIDRVQLGDDEAHQIAIGSSAYGVCSSLGNTTEKVVSLPGFTLNPGTTIHIKFNNANSAANPTLNVNNTGAKPIVQYDTEAVDSWFDGAVLTLTYDGTSWVRDQDTNTTYTISSSLTNGKIRIVSSAGEDYDVGVTGLAALAYKSELLESDIPNLSWTKITTNVPTTLSGYGITDAFIDNNGTITLGNETITPVVSVNGYTGSEITISPSDLGLSNALHFIGITSTTLTDGSTATTLTPKSANSLSKTTGFVDGDVVIDNDQLREYVFTNNIWILLGFTASTTYDSNSITASTVNEPTWISRITQATDGTISVERATLGILPITMGGTGVNSFTPNQVILSDNTNGTTGLISRAYIDNSTATALTTTSNFVTEKTIYYGLPTINDTHNYTSDTTIYAPITSGTAGQILISSGASPVWAQTAILNSIVSEVANEEAYTTLTLGNSGNKNSTTSHSEGKIVLYSAATGSHTIIGNSTANNYIHTLPNSDGTLVQVDLTIGTGSNTQPIYIANNGLVTPLTYTANRLYYSASTTSFEATNHYATSTSLALNDADTAYTESAPKPSYTFYVNGDSYFNGNTTHNGIDYFANGTTYYIDNNSDARLRNLGIGTAAISSSYALNIGGNVYLNGTHYFADGTTYYINNSAIAYLSDLRVDNTRLVNSYLGFYSEANAGGSRLGFIQGTTDKMSFRIENGTEDVVPQFDFNGHILPSVTDTYYLGSSSKKWHAIYSTIGYYYTNLWGDQVRLTDNWIGFYAGSVDSTTRYAYIQGAQNTLTIRNENGTSGTTPTLSYNGHISPSTNNIGCLGASDKRWAKLYVGTAANYGDAYTPVYWNDGVPAAVTPIQYCSFTIGSGKKGVKLTHTAFTAASYVTQVVVTGGESNLNSTIAWESATGYINLTCSATSGAVNGYILVSRGGAVTATATDIT